MIRKMVIMASLCALALVALASAASATTVKGGSGILVTNDVIGTQTGTDGVIGTAVLVTNLGNISCTTGGFAGMLGSNNGAGSVTATLTNLSFTGCTDNIPLITVSSCGATSGSLTATTAGSGGVVNVVTNVTCQAGIGTCIYGTGVGGVNGTFSNTNPAPPHSTLAFSGVSVAYAGGSLGSGTCGSTATFTATFGPVIANNNSSLLVTLV